MKKFLLRVSLPLAIVLYAATLADVSSGFTSLSLIASIVISLVSVIAAAGLSRLSTMTQSAIPFALLTASFFANASRIGGYETVVHRTAEEWKTYQRQLGLSIAEEISNRFTDLCRRSRIAAQTLSRESSLSVAAERPESQLNLSEAFRTLQSYPLPQPLPEAVSGATLYDQWLFPVAWVGKNVDLAPYFDTKAGSLDHRIFVLEKGVFTYLVVIEPLVNELGIVSIEIPLAAQRSLNNRYLTDFEVLTAWAGKGIFTDYVDFREDAPELPHLFDQNEDRYWGGTDDAPMLYFPLRSPSGEVLGVSSLAAEDPSTALLEHRRSTELLAGAILAVAALTIVVLLGLSFRSAYDSSKEITGRIFSRAMLFGGSIWFFRYVLLVSNVPLGLGSDADNPAHYASNLFFDFLRSPVDFLITALTTLVFISALTLPWVSKTALLRDKVHSSLRILLVRFLAGTSVLLLLIFTNHIIHDTWVNSTLPLSLPGLVPPNAPLLIVQVGLILLFLSAAIASFFIFRLAEHFLGTAKPVSLQEIIQIWLLDLAIIGAGYLVLVFSPFVNALFPSLVPMLAFHWIAVKGNDLFSRQTVGQSLQLRLLAYLLLFLLPVLAFYPALPYYEDQTAHQFMESTVAPTVLHHGSSQIYVLQQTLEAIDRMEIDGRLSVPEQADLAYRIWSGSDLSVTALSSSVEVFNDQSQLISRFALNFPAIEWNPQEPSDPELAESMARGDWVIWQDPYPGEPNRPHVLNARRILESEDRSPWDIRVRLVADWSNLPFILARNPYIVLFRAAGTETPLPSAHAELSLFVFDYDGSPIFRSSEIVLSADPQTIQVAQEKPVWVERSLDGQRHQILFFSDPDYIFAMAYPSKSALGFAAEVIGWAILSSLTAGALLLLIWLLDFLSGSILFPPRELWVGVGTSFYGKLFAAFILLALIPTALLAVLARGIVVQQLDSDVEQEGLSRARVVERFLRDYVLYQTIDARERGVAVVDDGVLEYVGKLVGSDVHLYSRGELVATSKRELFASGLLLTRAVPEVFQGIVLDRADRFVHTESVGWFRYLVVSVPISLERWGEPGILSIPLASRQREIERQVTALNQRVLLAAISFSLIAAALAYSLARRIADPINKLTEATRRVAQGDFEISVQASSEDEIGVLSKSFNQMTSDLKRQREHLERTKKLEAWAEMARQVAHEVKNPLTPIQLSTEYLLRVFDDKRVDFKKVLKDCTETILQQVRSLRQISMEFSTFANPTNVEPEPTDLASLVSETAAPYLQAPPKGVTVDVQITPEIPSVSVDKRLMKRTLVNLLENALHALNGHGHVAVSVQSIDDGSEAWVEVAVADNGEGIEPESLEHIFEPYFSTRASGTGLGLAIARKVVEDHGGTIALESEPGQGTRVYFRLPVGQAAVPPVGQAAPDN